MINNDFKRTKELYDKGFDCDVDNLSEALIYDLCDFNKNNIGENGIWILKKYFEEGKKSGAVKEFLVNLYVNRKELLNRVTLNGVALNGVTLKESKND